MGLPITMPFQDRLFVEEGWSVYVIGHSLSFLVQLIPRGR